MVVENIIADGNMDITGITLLSAEEYEKCKDIISHVDELWWLSSPGRIDSAAAMVLSNGDVDRYGDLVDEDFIAVRPALKIENIKSSGLDIGDTFTARGCTWTVISDGLALCDRCISDHCFRRECRADNANVYQFSDVKKFIEGWWGNAA